MLDLYEANLLVLILQTLIMALIIIKHSKFCLSMATLKIEKQVKINQQQQRNIGHHEGQKQQISANTQPPQEAKIKLQTKYIIEKKQQHEQIHPDQRIGQQMNNNFNKNQGTDNREHPRVRRRRALSHHERIQDVRLVATNFIQFGLNFRKFNQFYPQIDAKFYRNTVQAINNTAINQIQKYLRYECNIQTQKLNRDQKRSIRTQLTKVRQWLGKKDMGQLQTLYKFIQRKYELIDVQISIQEALRLYKAILQIVKSPFVDVMQDDIRPQTLDPEVNRRASKQQRQSQQKTLIILYIHHRNLTKVSDLLCEKFGYDIKWSKHAVKQKIKFLLGNSLKKLIGSVEAYDKSLRLFFSESEQCVDLLVKSENSLNLKVFLLQFYLLRTITLISLKQYIKKVNRFFIQQHKGHGQYQCKKFEQKVKIPKLQIKRVDLQKNLPQDSHERKKSQKQQQNLPDPRVESIKQQKNQNYLRSNTEKEQPNKKQDKLVIQFDQFADESQLYTPKDEKKIKLQY